MKCFLNWTFVTELLRYMKGLRGKDNNDVFANYLGSGIIFLLPLFSRAPGEAHLCCLCCFL